MKGEYNNEFFQNVQLSIHIVLLFSFHHFHKTLVARWWLSWDTVISNLNFIFALYRANKFAPFLTLNEIYSSWEAIKMGSVHSPPSKYSKRIFEFSFRIQFNQFCLVVTPNILEFAFRIMDEICSTQLLQSSTRKSKPFRMSLS